MKISIGSEFDVRKAERFRKQFGETSNAGLVRLAVGVGRESAVLTQVKGKSRKKQVGAIVTGARINISGIDPRQFNKIASRSKPSYRFDHRWVSLRDDQILRNAEEVNQFIEQHRNERGRVVRLPEDERAICKKRDLNRVIVERKKRAGMAKGSWLGAAMSASRFRQAGPNPQKIGKNFMSWAQKHRDLGTARMHKAVLGRSEVQLISAAGHTRRSSIFSNADARRAFRIAGPKMLAWYRREVRRRDRR